MGILALSRIKRSSCDATPLHKTLNALVSANDSKREILRVGSYLNAERTEKRQTIVGIFQELTITKFKFWFFQQNGGSRHSVSLHRPYHRSVKCPPSSRSQGVPPLG